MDPLALALGVIVSLTGALVALAKILADRRKRKANSERPLLAQPVKDAPSGPYAYPPPPMPPAYPPPAGPAEDTGRYAALALPVTRQEHGELVGQVHALRERVERLEAQLASVLQGMATIEHVRSEVISIGRELSRIEGRLEGEGRRG